MNRNARLVFGTFALLLASYLPAAQPAAAPAMREVADGALEHIASGMTFPRSVGNFARLPPRQYDAKGVDVSVGYNLSAPSITLTVYVYPSPPVRSFGSPAAVIADAKNTLARGEFDRTKKEILQAHSGAKLVKESSISRPADGTDSAGFFAHYSFSDQIAGQVRQLESLLYIYCHVGEGWTIKYRITYPAEIDAQPLIDQFMQSFRWTPKKGPTSR